MQYTMKGGGPETFEPHFTFFGFRYVAAEDWGKLRRLFRRGRCRPSAFGMYRRKTGCGRYVPARSAAPRSSRAPARLRDISANCP